MGSGVRCILADDMGLGKTFQSITLLWTLLTQVVMRLSETVYDTPGCI